MTQPQPPCLQINFSFGGMLAELIQVLGAANATLAEINNTTHRLETQHMTQAASFDDLTAAVAATRADVATLTDGLTTLSATVTRVAEDITTLLQAGNLTQAQQDALNAAVSDLTTANAQVVADTATVTQQDDTLTTADPQTTPPAA